MNKYTILAGSLIFVGSVMLVQQFYSPVKEEKYSFSSTDFIEPSEEFVNCTISSECMKIKGSACPPSEGGKEVCVNKSYFQQYISVIDDKAGSEAFSNCPQTNMVTDRTCGCVQNRCVMI
jgi:hypothetical protein